MNKIILVGVRSLATDEQIKPMRDYEIKLIAERISEEKIDNEDSYLKFRLKVSEISEIKELGETKPIPTVKATTPSQILRYRVESELGTYDDFMQWLLVNTDRIFDEYRLLNR
jgi:hypothetical protein